VPGFPSSIGGSAYSGTLPPPILGTIINVKNLRCPDGYTENDKGGCETIFYDESNYKS